MTEEGPSGDPMTEVEVAHALKGAASSIRTMHAELVEAGFSEKDAMMLTAAYLHGMAGGKLS